MADLDDIESFRIMKNSINAQRESIRLMKNEIIETCLKILVGEMK